MNNLPNLIVRLSQDPFNSDLNFDVAEEYLLLNQTASAVSFYLRCVEYSLPASPKGYASLLRMAKCFDDQKGRELSVTNCLLQALTFDDTRPEAYFFLSQYYEKCQNWQESYTWAVLGLGWANGIDPLPIVTDYFDAYSKRAICFYCLHEYSKSLLDVEKAMNSPGANKSYLLNLRGVNYIGLGNTGEACADFKVAMDGGNNDAVTNYQRFCVKK